MRKGKIYLMANQSPYKKPKETLSFDSVIRFGLVVAAVTLVLCAIASISKAQSVSKAPTNENVFSYTCLHDTGKAWGECNVTLPAVGQMVLPMRQEHGMIGTTFTGRFERDGVSYRLVIWVRDHSYSLSIVK